MDKRETNTFSMLKAAQEMGKKEHESLRPWHMRMNEVISTPSVVQAELFEQELSQMKAYGVVSRKLLHDCSSELSKQNSDEVYMWKKQLEDIECENEKEALLLESIAGLWDANERKKLKKRRQLHLLKNDLHQIKHRESRKVSWKQGCSRHKWLFVQQQELMQNEV